MGVTYFPKGVVNAVSKFFPDMEPGLGLGIGEYFFLVNNKTTDLYYQTLVNSRVRDDRIFTTLAAAYAATTANRGDVVCAFPGAYTPSASLTWSNSQTHLVGLGGLNQRSAPAAGTTGMVRFYCSTTSVTQIINVTGDYVTFSGFQMRNTYDSANNVCDLKIGGRNFTGKHLALRGGGGASQINAHAGIPLYLDGTGYANCAKFIECDIGDPFGTARTAGECIYIVGTGGQVADVEFKGCRIMTTSETAAVSAVVAAAGASLDRYMLFEDTLFYNFSVNLASILTQTITDNVATTNMFLLTGKTAQYGWGKWANAGTHVFGGIAVPYTTGGTMVTMT